VALSALAQRLKGASSRSVRQFRYPEVTSRLWGRHFWSASYCVVSCGGAPLEVIKRYVQTQAGATAGPLGGVHPRAKARGTARIDPHRPEGRTGAHAHRAR
jgi:hypothetical protein